MMFGRMKRPTEKTLKSWAETNEHMSRAWAGAELNLHLSVKRNRLDVTRMLRPMELEKKYGPVPHRKWNWLPWCRRCRRRRASILRGLAANDRAIRDIWNRLESYREAADQELG